MKVVFTAPPSGEELGKIELHELIRDYPELYSLLQTFGVDPGAEACLSLREILAQDDPRFGEIERALGWRRGSPG